MDVSDHLQCRRTRCALTDLRAEVLNLQRVAVGDPEARERRLWVIEHLLVRGRDTLTVYTELNRDAGQRMLRPRGAVGVAALRTFALLARSALSSPTVAVADASSSVTGNRFEGLAERGLIVIFIVMGRRELTDAVLL